MKWFSPKLWVQTPTYNENVDSIFRNFINNRDKIIFLYKDIDNVFTFFYDKRYYCLITTPFSCYGACLLSATAKGCTPSQDFNVLKNLNYSVVYTNRRASRKTIADFYNLVDIPATTLLRNHRLLGADDIFYNRQGKYGITLEDKVGYIDITKDNIYFRF